MDRGNPSRFIVSPAGVTHETMKFCHDCVHVVHGVVGRHQRCAAPGAFNAEVAATGELRYCIHVRRDACLGAWWEQKPTPPAPVPLWDQFLEWVKGL